ncbi:periplasmic chaperone for outer membrane protein SurA [Rubellimicrobium thermophilum DSM 16684]|uniref:Parvulin-like PPIase n=1 Tax=Rubellimicrobium thermophilum DSM 16684 TaxID=1123069 RepID=S9R1U4_9RHOB|nr:peptidylprolyl isomerase [Rubellimicrobium thermophilum]EPX85923.1 periplasmic chaperone for outer membrane protein SurA [Rubellimicrobium thermophilum DSM 16684]
MVRGLGRILGGMVCAAVMLAGQMLPAQDFSPVIVVNDRAVTGWELDQRERLLRFFGTPGDLPTLARRQLVDDRLRQQELERAGVSLTEEGRARAIEDFAARAGLSAEELFAELARSGIDRRTLTDYVEISTLWRDYIRARYGSRIDPASEEEIDRRLAQEQVRQAGIEVLLSEIIIPAPPEQAAAVQAVAEEIARTPSIAAFEAAARQYSAVPSRERGGRLDWVPLSNYPPALQGLLLSLAPGEVTPPLTLTGAVALLQLRDIREGTVPEAQPDSLDYAILRIPGGLTAPALARAARIDAEADRCDDLYGYRLPADQLLRLEQTPSEIPQDIALALAALDPGEASWGLTADGGQTLLFVMLCARHFPLPEGVPDRDTVAGAIRGERLQQYADALLAELRAAATIVGE